MLLLMHRGSHMQAQMLAEGDKNGCTAVHWAAYKASKSLDMIHK